MNTERYLIASLGSIGRRHLKNLRELRPDAEIAVWRRHAKDVGPELPEGADYQFTDIRQVMEFKPHAAIVAGPASTHVAVALQLAKAGIHLLLEKPISDSLEEVDNLIALCREKALTLMVGYNLRFYPSLAETRRMVQALAVGRVIAVRTEVGQYLPDWRPASDYRLGVTAQSVLGGGVLLELSHELDYLYWMFGMPDAVTARGGHLSDLEIDVEDTVELLLEYRSEKRLVNVHLDMVQRAPVRRCRIIGERGTLIWDAIADTIELYTAESGQWQKLEQYALLDRNRMYLDELSHFLDAAATAQMPSISGEQGRDVLLMVDAARRAIQSGKTIEMKHRV